MDLVCEERVSDSPYIEAVWRSHSEGTFPFVSIAQSRWGMVITKMNGKTMLTVRGPETKATPAYNPGEAEFIGILFKPGTLMPDFPANTLMDRADVTLPVAANQCFWLKSATWQYPDYDNVETFINCMVQNDLLLYDADVADVLNGKLINKSLRTVQRRILKATGLTHGTIDQIKRARLATTLLKSGVSILDTVEQAGYADQPHLTRSLKRFTGFTPTQIMSEDRDVALSFLYKAP